MRTIFLVAGEASGDFLGAHLMKTLKKQYKDQLNFEGIGGPLMKAEGLQTWFPYKELAVMGLVEVLPKAFGILRRLGEAVHRVKGLSPDLIITIDSPGFNLRLAKRIRKAGIKTSLIHYVAPQVWAWRARRAKKMASLFDHLMCLFPFEPPYFERVGLSTTYAGHPLVEVDIQKDPQFLGRHGIAEDSVKLVLLPGSRQGELSRHISVFQQACLLLQRHIPNVHLLIPTLPHLKEAIEAAFQDFQIPHAIIFPEEKFQALIYGDVALAASGTVSLELALCGLPAVIGYKVSPLTYACAKRLVRVPYISLVNLLLNRPLLSERIQQDCNPTSLCEDMLSLIQSREKRDGIREGYVQAVASLYPRTLASPSEAILEVIQQYL